MGDEVTLIPGMRLKVSRIYDDAWYVDLLQMPKVISNSSDAHDRATGQVMECVEDPSLKGREGAFPLVCVTQANVPIVANRA